MWPFVSLYSQAKSLQVSKATLPGRALAWLRLIELEFKGLLAMLDLRRFVNDSFASCALDACRSEQCKCQIYTFGPGESLSRHRLKGMSRSIMECYIPILLSSDPVLLKTASKAPSRHLHKVSERRW